MEVQDSLYCHRCGQAQWALLNLCRCGDLGCGWSGVARAVVSLRHDHVADSFLSFVSCTAPAPRSRLGNCSRRNLGRCLMLGCPGAFVLVPPQLPPAEGRLTSTCQHDVCHCFVVLLVRIGTSLVEEVVSSRNPPNKVVNPLRRNIEALPTSLLFVAQCACLRGKGSSPADVQGMMSL